MDIRRMDNINPNTEASQIAPIVSDELESQKVDDDDQRNLNKQSKQKAKAKRLKTSNKPASVAILNNAADAEDLVDDFMSKIATRQAKQRQETSKKQLHQDIKKTVQDMFEKKDLVQKDGVTLSKIAQNMKKNKLEQKSTVSTILDATEDLSLTQELGQKSATAQTDTELKKSTQKRASFSPIKGEQPPEKSLQKSLSKYLELLTEATVKNNQTKAKELKQLKQSILKQGYTPKKLRALEGNLQHLLKSQLKKQVKKSFIKYALAYSGKKPISEIVEHKTQFDDIVKLADLKGVFGKDFDSLEALKDNAKQELQTLVADELDRSLIQAKLTDSSTDSLSKAFDRFNTLAGISRFDANEFIKGISKKIDDMGLAHFQEPEQASLLNQSGQNPNQNSDQSTDQSEEEIDPIEDAEDKLRTLIIQYNMQSGVLSSIRLKMKIKKQKKQLSSFGYTDNQLQKLMDEAKAIARIHFMKMLTEALEERATLATLKGPDYDLMKRKMKTAIKGLKKIGFKPTKKALKDLRDKINRALFPVIKETYLKTEVALQANQYNPYLMQKRTDCLSILERIKEESKISEAIRPDSLQNITFTSDTNIIEAA